jgi:hypothetical protein
MLFKIGNGSHYCVMWGTTQNVFHLVLVAMFKFGGLTIEKLGVKLTSMGCDGSTVFQGA